VWYLIKWVKEAGNGIYIYGARVEMNTNEPMHNGMTLRKDEEYTTFLWIYSIQVW
jgi:hypothetical protein